MKNKNILIVAAHPDDEILGCGGTVAKLVKEGYRAHTLILSEGVASRGKSKTAAKREMKELKKEALRANETVGAESVFIYDLPDNRFDSVALLDIVKIVEEIKNKIKPEIIFTHHEKDLNIDHQITYKAVITAARPAPGESVKEIYSFEVLSSTEWAYPLTFSPDFFVDIMGTLDLKLKAMNEYKLELMDFPHPRSIEGIKINVSCWGMKTGLKYAEAFKTVRRVK